MTVNSVESNVGLADGTNQAGVSSGGVDQLGSLLGQALPSLMVAAVIPLVMRQAVENANEIAREE